MKLEITIAGKKEPAVSFLQASVKFRRYIEQDFLGASDLKKTDGRLSVGGKTIGRVSYNGRVWLTNGTEVAL
jgi:hypothetical protein